MATTNFREESRAANNKSNARKKRRRRKKIIATVIALLCISIITLGVLSLTVFFKIEKINVTGSTTYTAENIISSAGIANGDNLILASEKEIAAKLQKKLPYIDEVSVEKHYPGELVINVKETAEEICIKNENVCFAANKEGKVLKQYDSIKENLILVTVSENATMTEGDEIAFSSDREYELFTNFMNMLETGDLDVNFINISDPFSSYIKIENRIIAKFGSSSYFENKVAYLKASLKGISEKAEGVFDLSAWTPENNRPVLTYGDISSYEE